MTGKLPNEEQREHYREHYSPGYGTELIRSYQRRSVTKEASFLISHLKPGMSLLDCGCGPGTITAGLANLIAPGQVTGIDKEAGQIDRAYAYARDQDVTNVRFQEADIYQLPFANESFDVVFMHALLQHLQNPLKALKEANRVLKPGGIIGVRDDDQGSLIMAPYDDKMERVIQLLKQVMKYSGGDPYAGRRHRELLGMAGFTNIQATASCESDGILEETRKRGNLAAKLLEHMSETIVQQGWCTKKELTELQAACREWGQNPDAFDGITWCEAVGWKPL